jgi:hypothetical protein
MTQIADRHAARIRPGRLDARGGVQKGDQLRIDIRHNGADVVHRRDVQAIHLSLAAEIELHQIRNHGCGAALGCAHTRDVSVIEPGAVFAPVYIVTNGGPNGATQLLMFEAYQTAFAYLNHGRSLAISTIILIIILAIALIELRLFRSEDETSA